jgi:hypothetical protein
MLKIILKFFSCRFVNYVTEPYQSSLKAQPVKTIAKNVTRNRFLGL